MTFITQLGKFTVKPAELENCDNQYQLHLMTSRPIGIAIEIPDFSCPNLVRSRVEGPPTYKLTHWSGGGVCSHGVREAG